jgi:hypothetical protein
MVRNDDQFGVLASEKRNRSASKIAEDALRLVAAGESSDQPSPALVGR